MVEIPSTVVITGASSGIGEALAVHYARAAKVLGLVGRDRDRLERVAERCRASGCAVRLGLIDVRDRASLGAWLRQFDQDSPIDLVIANAGIAAGLADGQQIENAEAAFLLMETNILGVINTVQPLLPLMLSRGRGQIALMSSVTALAPSAVAPSYSASKAAVMAYGIALRDSVHHAGVRVNVLCPGYITTAMTARFTGWKPLEMTPDAAAKRMIKELARDRAVIAFPWPFILAARSSQLLPNAIRRLAMRPFGGHIEQ